MDIILGIDIGGSTTKVVGLDPDGNPLSMLRVRAEDQVTSLFGALGNYLTSNSLTLQDVRRVVLTGVGASYVDGDIYGLPTCRVDEFSASGMGALALSGQERAVVATMGTGTAFLLAEQNGRVQHLCGSGIGGGTLGGLCHKLVGMERFGQIKKLALGGDLGHRARAAKHPNGLFLQFCTLAFQIADQGDHILRRQAVAHRYQIGAMLLDLLDQHINGNSWPQKQRIVSLIRSKI